nr:MAG TPA: Protein of unknown function (DUF722) [Bacteriophage sp.]
MTTKEYLSQIRRYDCQISNKLEEIKELRLRISGTSSFSNGDRVQTSGSKDQVGSCVSKIVDMEREVDALIDKRLEIVKQIEAISDADMYDVLAKKWILKKGFKVIGIEMKKSDRQVFNIYENAMDLFEHTFGHLYL